MKEGWEYKTLGECCETINGLWKGKKEPFVNVGVIRNANFTKEMTLDFSNIEYLYVEEKQFKSRKLRKGDLIVEKSGGSDKQPVGRAVLFLEEEGNYSFSNFTSVLRILNKDELLYTFLHKYLLYIYRRGDTKSMQKATTGIHNIEFEKYLNIQVPIIPIDEQRRIVSYLDSSFKLIDEIKNKALKSLTEAKALFQSALAEAMEPKEGWEEKTLKEVAKYRRGSFPQPYGKKEWYDGKGSMPFVQVADLQEDHFDLNDITKKRISKKAQEFSVFVKKGTVLVSLQGSIGKVAITQYDSYVDRTVAIFFKIDDFLNKYFFAIQLKLRFEIERVKARGTTIKTITKEEFSNFSINIPPLSTQKQIVSHLDSLSSKVRAIEEKYQKIVEECDALKQAMLRDVFE